MMAIMCKKPFSNSLQYPVSGGAWDYSGKGDCGTFGHDLKVCHQVAGDLK